MISLSQLNFPLPRPVAGTSAMPSERSWLGSDTLPFLSVHRTHEAWFACFPCRSFLSPASGLYQAPFLHFVGLMYNMKSFIYLRIVATMSFIYNWFDAILFDFELFNSHSTLFLKAYFRHDMNHDCQVELEIFFYFKLVPLSFVIIGEICPLFPMEPARMAMKHCWSLCWS